MKWRRLKRKSYECLLYLVMTDEWRVDGLIGSLDRILLVSRLLSPYIFLMYNTLSDNCKDDAIIVDRRRAMAGGRM